MQFLIGSVVAAIVIPIGIHLLRREEIRSPFEKFKDTFNGNKSNSITGSGKTIESIQLPLGYMTQGYRDGVISGIKPELKAKFQDEQKYRK